MMNIAAPTKTSDIVMPEAVDLIYRDIHGQEHVQPGVDLDVVGPMSDPSTDGDMPLVAVRLGDELHDPESVTLVYGDPLEDDPEYADEEFEQPASDLVEAGTLCHPESGGELEFLHAYVVIGQD